MVLTKVLNVSGDFEYINLDQVTNIAVEVTGGDDYYHVEFSGRGSVAIAITEAKITALISAAV
ncbi:MAG: hypothetical protein KAT90_11060 [Gammaproteobacteria bacterium]|nr:hypothetical protein [Gammaproteobacteria bacterium]